MNVLVIGSGGRVMRVATSRAPTHRCAVQATLSCARTAWWVEVAARAPMRRAGSSGTRGFLESQLTGLSYFFRQLRKFQ